MQVVPEEADRVKPVIWDSYREIVNNAEPGVSICCVSFTDTKLLCIILCIAHHVFFSISHIGCCFVGWSSDA